jgi:hypothetical protein
MASAGWKDKAVSGRYMQFASTWTTQNNLRFPHGDAQNFMRSRMIVVIIKDAVAPDALPAASGKSALKGVCQGSAFSGELAINNNRQSGIVGNQPFSDNRKCLVFMRSLLGAFQES